MRLFVLSVLTALVLSVSVSATAEVTWVGGGGR